MEVIGLDQSFPDRSTIILAALLVGSVNLGTVLVLPTTRRTPDRRQGLAVEDQCQGYALALASDAPEARP
jgi:hypothetical protein